MNISDDGVKLIKSFEGYLTRQPDGSCVAYLCPARVPTIGWGCTEGVRLGMRWTEAEAIEGLKRELAKHEAAVNRLVTVEINQNQFDALTSFSYNCGVGALQKSTLLKRLNKGDYDGAAQAFASWNKGGGRVLKGLVARRAREAALFLKPVEQPSEPYMPQKVDQTVEVSTTAKVGGGAAVAVPAVEVLRETVSTPKTVSIPKPPIDVTEVSAYQTIIQTVGDFGTFMLANKVTSIGVLLFIVGVYFYPKLRGQS